MPIVDSHGRLLGRLNVIDAIAALLLLGLLPLAYGAYTLFRTPPPRLVAVEPGTMVNGPNLRVAIKGENLRPYMRVSFGNIQGNSFIFRNTSEALVDLNAMPPGVYDVVLYDTAQEQSRLRDAFTLTPPPLPASQVIAVGTIGNVTAEQARQIVPGMKVQGVGEIVAVSAPLPETTRVYAGPVLEIPIEKAVRVPVSLLVGCSVRAPQGMPHCAVGDAPLQPLTMLVLNTPVGTLPFQIDQLRSAQPLEAVDVVVQMTGRRELLAQITAGDTDHGQYVNPLAAGAVVNGVTRPLTVGGDTQRVDVNLRTRAQRTSNGWTYASAPLRVGSVYYLRTAEYELQGIVVRITPEWTPPSEGQRAGQ
jgi:hypothetical protein